MGTRRLIVYRSGAGEEGVKNYFDTKDARGAKGRRIAFPVNRMGIGVCRPNYICIMATRLAIDRAVSSSHSCVSSTHLHVQELNFACVSFHRLEESGFTPIYPSLLSIYLPRSIVVIRHERKEEA